MAPSAPVAPVALTKADAPTLEATYQVFLEAVRESLTMRVVQRCGNPLGCTKRVALFSIMKRWASGPCGAAHIIPRTHTNNWKKLITSGRIVVSEARGSEAHYLPGCCYLKTPTGMVLDMDRVMRLINDGTTGEEVLA